MDYLSNCSAGSSVGTRSLHQHIRLQFCYKHQWIDPLKTSLLLSGLFVHGTKRSRVTFLRSYNNQQRHSPTPVPFSSNPHNALSLGSKLSTIRHVTLKHRTLCAQLIPLRPTISLHAGKMAPLSGTFRVRMMEEQFQVDMIILELCPELHVIQLPASVVPVLSPGMGD